MIKSKRAGFTMLELVFVLVVTAVLLSAMMPDFGRIEASIRVMNARDAYMMMAARARAEASARGVTIRIRLDPDADRAQIIDNTGSTIDAMTFTDNYGADITTENHGPITVCYTSRGIALPSCTTITDETAVTFTRGGEQAVALVRPLGQVVIQ